MAQFNIQMFLFLLLVTQFLDKFNSKKHDKKTYNSFLGGLLLFSMIITYDVEKNKGR
jgi:hypothetical protein